MSDHATPPPAPPAPPPPAPPAAWYDGADSETVGWLQTKGWDKDPKAAALGATKSYREAEKFLHAPPDQLVRFPKDAADTENWNKLNARLGVPADPKDYDFAGIKRADGTDLDANDLEFFRKTASDAKLSKTQAVEHAKAVLARENTRSTTDAAEKAALLATERETLKINWGSNVTANMIVAKAAAEKLGVTPDQVSALENVVGYAKVMEMFRNIGARMGEDKFVSGSGSTAGGVMSKDQASATLNEKMADSQWATKFTAGDVAARREFDNLTRIIAGSG